MTAKIAFDALEFDARPYQVIIQMSLRSSFDESKSLTQFCALAYRGEQADETIQAKNQVILILIYSQATGMRLLASPEWLQIVRQADQAYIAEILADFRERTRSGPEDLLEQICYLSVGPLITYAHGIRLEEHPELHALSSTFIELG